VGTGWLLLPMSAITERRAIATGYGSDDRGVVVRVPVGLLFCVARIDIAVILLPCYVYYLRSSYSYRCGVTALLCVLLV
jgi:hypothetical protein